MLYNEGTLAWFDEVPSWAPSCGAVASAKGMVQVGGATVSSDEPASGLGRYRFKIQIQDRVGRSKVTVSSMLSSAAGEKAMVIEVEDAQDRDAWVAALRLLAGRQFSFTSKETAA